MNNNIDLLSLVGGLKKTGAGWWAGECPMCGGKDRFVVAQKPDGYRWMCRKCSPTYQDGIAFVMQRDHLTFPEALKVLGGGTMPSPAHRDTSREESYTYQAPDLDWQQETLKGCMRDHLTLLYDTEAQAGRDYLAKRGITYAAILAFNLGFDKVRGSITIPHLHGDTLLAVKYRTLHGDQRYYMTKGSKPMLYNIPRIPGDTILVVEGEINCISIWQESRRQGLRIDAVSPGSETLSAYAKTALKNLSRYYKRSIAWFDDEARSQEISSLVGASKVLRSPMIDDVKHDANQVLQMGRLGDILQEVTK